MSDWIVGFHAVLSELQSGRSVELLWLQKGRKDKRLQHLLDAARSRGVVTKWIPRARLDDLAGQTPHNGCAARCSPVALVPVSRIVAPEASPSRLLLLDDLSDPHNLGAVLRSAAAFGVEGVVIAGPSAPPLGGAAAKAAAGLMGRVPIVRATVAADALAVLRAEGYWALGADAAGAPMSEISSCDRWVLCVGSEVKGLRAKTRSQIDELVRIPMAEGVESLNVSVATGVLLYHLCHVWEIATSDQ